VVEEGAGWVDDTGGAVCVFDDGADVVVVVLVAAPKLNVELEG